MSLPHRASLPHPLPDNVLVFPGTLDRLVLRFGDLPVRVSSEATGADAGFAQAVAGRRLSTADGSADGHDMPVTAEEAAALSGFQDLVEDWTVARASGDLYGMMAVVARLRKRDVPWWLDVRIDMPSRVRRALSA